MKKRIFSDEHKAKLKVAKSIEHKKKISDANKGKTSIIVEDIIGQKFGRLTVNKFSKVSKEKKPWKYFYECFCECGNVRDYVRTNLITNHTVSCGCIKRKRGSESKTWKGYGQISGRLFTRIKRGATERSIPFEITIEQAWSQFEKQNGLCNLTKIPLIIEGFKENYSAQTASLDRIDSDKGYIVGNIQWLHKDINWIKGDFTQDEFIRLCKAVAENN